MPPKDPSVDPECTLIALMGEGGGSQGASKTRTRRGEDDVNDNSVVLRYGDGEYSFPLVNSTVVPGTPMAPARGAFGCELVLTSGTALSGVRSHAGM